MSQDTQQNKASPEFDDEFFKTLEQDIDTKSTNANPVLDDLDFLADLDTIKTNAAVETSLDTDIKEELPAIPEAALPKVETVSSDVEPIAAGATTIVNNIPITDSAKLDGSKDELIGVAAKPAKKGLFGKSESKNKTTKTTAKKDPKAKSPIMLILAVVGVLLVLGLLWVFLGQSDAPAEPPAPTEAASVVESAPTEVAPEETAEPAPTESSTENTAPSENTAPTEANTEFTKIDADAIVQAEIPDDPALIKEEIDRLADENSRLIDQAKDIDGLLSDTQKLTSAKEEQIALLEAQIAQLEAQGK